MKTKSYILSAFATLAIAFTGCSPDEVNMGTKDIKADDLVQGLAYSVTPDASNPNIIHLKSLLPSSYAVQWQHPQGYSQERELDLNIAFDGTYEIIFGVETRGGLVYGSPYEFTIDQFCADFVTGEMWDMLAGGAGGSKTWIPDDGTYGMKQGYYSCFDPSATWVDMVRDEGKNNWYAQNLTWWEPSNADVGITEDDLRGEMTFDLKGRAGLTVTTYTGGVPTTVEGMFDMNTDNHTMNATNVDFLHPAWVNGKAVDFRKGFQILVLTENQMMIANYRDEAMSGEGRCIYCYNFVSKDYADSYVPEVGDEPAPTLPDGWMQALETQNHYAQWKFDTKNPADWCDLYGNTTNTFSYSFNEDNVSALRLKMGAPDLDDYSVTLPDGSTVTGKFVINSNGTIDFSNGLGNTVIAGDNVTFSANANSQLEVLGMSTDDYSRLSDLWLGRIVTDINGSRVQYLGYHLVADYGVEEAVTYKTNLNYFNTDWTFWSSENLYISSEGTYTITISGADSSPYGLYLDCFKLLGDYPNCDLVIRDIKVDGSSVDFDDNIIDRGTGDDATTARRYIMNPWGESAVYADRLGFGSTLSVTFEVKFDTGSPFIQ